MTPSYLAFLSARKRLPLSTITSCPKALRSPSFGSSSGRRHRRGLGEHGFSGVRPTRTSPGDAPLRFHPLSQLSPRGPNGSRADKELPNLAAHLFEAMLQTDLAEKYAIQSVPTLLIDQELRYVGGLEEEKLHSLLGAGDPESFLHEKIRKQIKEGGNALEAAEWIAGGGDPSFLATDLGASTFEERIALLLTLEEALETDPRCLDRMVDPLLPHLEAENASVRGDIADLLGKIGDRKALPALKKLLEDPDPNVVEAAEEAVETIEEGS